MKMDDIARPERREPRRASPEVYQQLGDDHAPAARHDGAARRHAPAAAAADGLPDARSRLTYIATKTADGGEQGAELGRSGQGRARDDRRRDAAHGRGHRRRPGEGRGLGLGDELRRRRRVATARIDEHLTDIMMAQDFHDLTGPGGRQGRHARQRPRGQPRQAAGPDRAAGQAPRRPSRRPSTARWSIPTAAPTWSPNQERGRRPAGEPRLLGPKPHCAGRGACPQ